MPILRISLLALLTLGLSSGVRAQGLSPVADHLRVTRSALSDHRYAEAAQSARALLQRADLLRGERLEALHLLAGALYPEVESFRQRELALEALQSAVRLSPAAQVPREVSWQGLDRLWDEARRTTFGVGVTPPGGEVPLGLGEAARLEVLATRPADIVLIAEQRSGGQRIRLDSLVGVLTDTLRLVVAHLDRVILASGEYDLIVQAVETGTADTLVARFPARVSVPPLQLLPVVPFNPAALWRERTAPKRVLGLIAGIAIAGATVTAASVAKGGTLQPDVPRDSRVVPLATFLGITTSVGVWLLDRGRPIPANIASNTTRLAAHQADLEAREAENRRRIQSYRAQLTIGGELR